MTSLLAGLSTTTGIERMKIQQKIFIVAASFLFLIFLILAFATPTSHGMTNRNVVVDARTQPLSLKMLAHVVRYCEKHDEPIHPGIVRWASASLTTDDNQLVQADSKMANGLFWRK